MKQATTPKEVTKNVIPKIRPDQNMIVQVAKDSVIGDYGVMVFYAMNETPVASFVVSEPIGKTKVKGYTINRTKDVPILKVRASDPSKDRVKESQKELRQKLLIEGGVLVKDGPGCKTTPGMPIPNTEEAKLFEEAHKEWKKAKEAFDEEQKKLPKGRRKAAFKKDIKSFYSLKESQMDAKIKQVLLEKDFRTQSEALEDTGYQTLLDDGREQKALVTSLPVTTGGIPRVMDQIQTDVYRFLTNEPVALDDQVKNLKTKIADLESKLKVAETQVEASKNRVLAESEAVAALTQENLSLGDKLNAAIEENSQLRTEIETLLKQGEQEE